MDEEAFLGQLSYSIRNLQGEVHKFKDLFNKDLYRSNLSPHVVEIVNATDSYFWDLQLQFVQLSNNLGRRFAEWNSFVETAKNNSFPLTENSACSGYFSFLPDELFQHILEYLTERELITTAQVSRRWRIICEDPTLWKSLHVKNEASLQSSSKFFLDLPNHFIASSPSLRNSPYLFDSPSAWSGAQQSPATSWRDLSIHSKRIEKKWTKPGSFDGSVYTLSGHTAWICCLRFNSDYIISAAGDRTLRIWSMHAKTTVDVLKATRGVLCLQFDSRNIIGGCMDNSIYAWDFASRRRVATLSGHTGRVWALQYDDWGRMISGSADKTLREWDLITNTEVSSVEAHQDGLSCLQFEGNVLVSGATDARIKIWDLITWNCVSVIGKESSKSVFCLALLNNSLMSGSPDSAIKEWDLRMLGQEGNEDKVVRSYEGHTKSVFGVQFDGQKVVSCSGDSTIKIWNRDTGECCKTLTGHTDAIRTIQYDLTRIVSGASTKDKTIKIWDFGS